MTTLLPPIDLRKPAEADGNRVVEAIGRWKVTRISGAPAYMKQLLRSIEHDHRKLPTVRAIGVGGAPVGRTLSARIVAAFPQAECYGVYGSTEAEPIASISLGEVARTEGDGYLVGRPVEVADVELVRLPEFSPRLDSRGIAPYRARPDESGEVVVSGPHVNRRYIGDDEATRRLKVLGEGDTLWHRTGDLALRDGQGRLWLTGRSADAFDHRGASILPYVLEADIGALPHVRVAAVVAHARAVDGEVVIELEGGDAPTVEREAKQILARRNLSTLLVRTIAYIPTDSRHQSKIDRIALRASLARG